MKKPKNLKQRNADSIMKPLEKAKLDPFKEVEERGWGIVRPLTGSEPLKLDWRIQWGDNPTAEQARLQQLVSIEIGNQKVTVSRQELERYLRHV